ncbi:MAG: hypothetical protein HY362_04020 [Candidatus Aenigmarchaeota archaeon]|nr:hypothetical protein [Candidatus Aenigmarchaeota archaeon]
MKTQQLSLEHMHKDILSLKENVEELRMVIEDEIELSGHAKRLLAESRRREKSEFTEHEAVRREFL